MHICFPRIIPTSLAAASNSLTSPRTPSPKPSPNPVIAMSRISAANDSESSLVHPTLMRCMKFRHFNTHIDLGAPHHGLRTYFIAPLCLAVECIHVAKNVTEREEVCKTVLDWRSSDHPTNSCTQFACSVLLRRLVAEMMSLIKDHAIPCDLMDSTERFDIELLE